VLTLQYPWILLLLVLPLLLSYGIKRAKTTPAEQSLKVPFFEQIDVLQQNQSSKQSNITILKQLLAYVIWALLVISSANPQWLGKPITLPQQSRNVLLAIDLSGSMQTQDMALHGRAVSRFTIVKQVAKQFINDRSTDRIGLILFGSKAYTLTPLTFDHTAVIDTLDDASIGLAGQQTAIGDALAIAIKRLDKQSIKSRILILLTDGQNNAGIMDPKKMAQLAKKSHIKIYTIGLGADRATVQTFFGAQVMNPSADLDSTLLKNIATRTGGFYFRAKDSEGLAKAYQAINHLETINKKSPIYQPKRELYPWPLSLAIVLALLMLFSELQLYHRPSSC
jgi:Ca-activated chloride channel family protein